MNLIRLVNIVFLGRCFKCLCSPASNDANGRVFASATDSGKSASAANWLHLLPMDEICLVILRSYQAADIQVGDLITVLLNETTQASRTSGLSTSRETENDVIGPDQLNSIVDNLGFGATFMTNAETDGSGD
jgi:hypothetical protein